MGRRSRHRNTTRTPEQEPCVQILMLSPQPLPLSSAATVDLECHFSHNSSSIVRKHQDFRLLAGTSDLAIREPGQKKKKKSEASNTDMRSSLKSSNERRKRP